MMIKFILFFHLLLQVFKVCKISKNKENKIKYKIKKKVTIS